MYVYLNQTLRRSVIPDPKIPCHVYLLPIYPIPKPSSNLSISHQTQSNKRTSTQNPRPHPCRRSRSSDFRRHVQIIHIPRSTPQTLIAPTHHTTRLCAHQARRLWCRRHASGVAFATVFNARVEVGCCGGSGETGQGRGDAEVGGHAVV